MDTDDSSTWKMNLLLSDVGDATFIYLSGRVRRRQSDPKWFSTHAVSERATK